MGEISTMEKTITLAELAEQSAGKYDTLYRKAKRMFPAEAWTKDAMLSVEQIRILSGNPAKVPASPTVRKPRQVETKSEAIIHTPAPQKPGVETPPARQNRDWMLYGLLITATAASVLNMYRVTAELSEANMSALLLTIVLSVSAIVFVLSGVRRRLTYALAGLLIAYECMCNMTRIHAGLYTENGDSTRFLGQFCDTFSTGTHQSAFFLAAFTAFFIAAVQYAAVFELNKK